MIEADMLAGAWGRRLCTLERAWRLGRRSPAWGPVVCTRALAALDNAGVAPPGTTSRPRCTLMLVESPSKAKKLSAYLGSGFVVLASCGHVRDLKAKDGAVKPDAGFELDWVNLPRAAPHLAAMREHLATAHTLVLASDPDREGEAIAWHLFDTLTRSGDVRPGLIVQRVTFTEITKNAILAALAAPRDISQPLVDAYLARRALDFLVGFTLSPVLWRKLPGAKSAGRVQSAALRLVCEREAAIESFAVRDYYSVEAALKAGGCAWQARLTHLSGKSLTKFALGDADAAAAAAARVEAAAASQGGLRITAVDTRKIARQPSPPLTTAALQQSASSLLGMGTARAMSAAQQLYENGRITYHRTDGVDMALEAIESLRATAAARFGPGSVHATPRVFKARKAANAQEAHEAIRPTDPADVPVGDSTIDTERIYALVWSRAISSQMASAELETRVAVAGDTRGDVALRASASRIVAPGYLAAFSTVGLGEMDDVEMDEDSAGALNGTADHQPTCAALAALSVGTRVTLSAPPRCTPHATQPPARYSDGTLVKDLEAHGVGRPSTYAPILRLLTARGYVLPEGRRLVPTSRGRILSAFLELYFLRYVDYRFTSSMEDSLDDVSAGKRDWKDVLSDFWPSFREATAALGRITGREVIDGLNTALASHFFPVNPEGDGPPTPADFVAARRCPMCGTGTLTLKLSKWGSFIGCNAHPLCTHTSPLVAGIDRGDGDEDPAAEVLPRELGTDPATGDLFVVKRGPFGLYVEATPALPAEPAVQEPKPKKRSAAKQSTPRRASLPEGVAASSVDLQLALMLLAPASVLGLHPVDGLAVELVTTGKFGPYIRHGEESASWGKAPLEDATMEAALEKLNAKAARSTARAAKRGFPSSKTITAAAESAVIAAAVAPEASDSTVTKRRGRPRKAS